MGNDFEYYILGIYYALISSTCHFATKIFCWNFNFVICSFDDCFPVVSLKCSSVMLTEDS